MPDELRFDPHDPYVPLDGGSGTLWAVLRDDCGWGRPAPPASGQEALQPRTRWRTAVFG